MFMKHGDAVQILTPDGTDLAGKLPALVEQATQLRAENTSLDGVLVSSMKRAALPRRYWNGSLAMVEKAPSFSTPSICSITMIGTSRNFLF